MADGGWNFSTLINSLDDKIASATPKVDFSAIGNLPDAYQKGFENKQARDLAGAFKGGVPTNPDGSPNYGEMAKTLFKLGNIQQGTALANAGQTQQLVSQQNGPMPSAPQPSYAPPQNLPNTGSSQPQSSPSPQPPQQMPAPGPAVQSSPRVMGDAEGVNNGTYDAPPAPGQRPPVQPDVPGASAPMQPRPVQTQRILPPGQPNQMGTTNPTEPVAPAGYMQAVMERAFQGAAVAAQAGNKALSEALLAKAKSIEEQLKPTPEIKNYNLGRQPGESLVDFTSRQKGQEALNSKASEGLGEVIGTAMKAGQTAHEKIQSLAIMKDALDRAGNNIWTGPGASTVLKNKVAISNAFGIDIKGLDESQIVSKIGFGLATQVVRAITARPTQMEVGMALANNPGLLLTPRASKMMIDILGQQSRQEAELARMAQNKTNWNNWGDIVDGYYKSHPILSPFDHKTPLGMSDVAKITGTPGGSDAGLKTFNSTAEARKAGATRFLDTDGNVRELH